MCFLNYKKDYNVSCADWWAWKKYLSIYLLIHHPPSIVYCSTIDDSAQVFDSNYPQAARSFG